MPGTYPTRFDFIMCEDVRQEASKKLTLVGMFLGTKIGVPVGTDTAILALTLLWIFDDGGGSFSQRCEITGPRGFRIVTSSQDGTKAPDQAHVYALGLKPSPPMPIGKYVAKVFLDEQTYERSFEIFIDAQLQAPPPGGIAELIPPKLSS